MLDRIEKYFITNNNIIDWTNNIIENYERKVIKKEEKEKEKEKCITNYFTIDKNDSLFWTFFYIFNGEFEYMSIHNEFSTEKLMKIDLLEKIRKNKDILKKYKVKSNYIEDQLLNSNTIDVTTFCILCILNNISFILHNKYFYWSHICNEEIFIINNIKKKCKIFTGNDTNNEIECIKKNRIEVSNINKLIKSMSSYKMAELKDICEKLNINMFKNTGKKKKKQEIYQELCELI